MIGSLRGIHPEIACRHLCEVNFAIRDLQPVGIYSTGGMSDGSMRHVQDAGPFVTLWKVAALILISLLPVQALGTASAATELETSLRGMHEICVHPGINSVVFAGFNNKGTILELHVDAGAGTGSHSLFIVTSESKSSDWELVPLTDNGRPSETIDDAPNDAETILKSVRFFTGRYGGDPATFLIVAQMNPDPNLAGGQGSAVTISVQQLKSTALGDPPFEFEEIDRFRTLSKYYSSNSALRRELNIPLSACFH